MVGEPSDLYYRRLELGPDASHDEIVHAYRRLAHLAHPDAHPKDPEAPRRFREITEAYEVLADPGRRAGYDRTRGPGRIRVTVRPVPSSGGRSAFGTSAGEEPPVLLGCPPRSLGDSPLRAGPVHVVPASEGASEGQLSPAGAPEGGIWQAFAEMLDFIWRC
jgi:curved DNA-binding protein CbpA